MGRSVVKKGINIFSKKGFLRGGTNVAKGGDQKIFLACLRAQIVPPPKQKPSYAPGKISKESEPLDSVRTPGNSNLVQQYSPSTGIFK